jgi:tRNA nucleotidyltransferase (CCA-adding enzyme)
MLNKNIKYIINKIEKHNFKAYLVGGAVRNFVLGLEAFDFDITTNALPDDIENIFPKTIPTGKKYGTITVIHDNNSYEITTFRSDGIYSDGRRPDSVSFSTELIEDLKRRDFTINALCIDIEEKLIDCFNGIEDIKNKVIRCIGNPDERFTEDALRMMRAVRFMTQLKFTMDEDTRLSIIKNNALIKKVSVERISEELNKILLSDKPSDGIRALVDTGLMKHIIPEFMDTIGFNQHNPYHDKDVFEHTMEVLDNTKPKLNLRLSALLHDISKPECFTQDKSGRGHFYEHELKSSQRAKLIMERLKYPHDITEDVRVLIRYHLLKSVDMKDKGVKRFINNVGIDRLDNMFELNIADIKGKSKIADISGFERLEILREKCKNIFERKEPLSKKDLKINGNDLEALGIKKGPIYTEILNKVLDLVLEFPEKNIKEELEKYVLSLVNPGSDK